tara:strand:+ start:13013 stop:16744 length:3732 start_codon:yes stop_codon:yes gene_type:complete
MSGPFGSQHWMYKPPSESFYPYEINNSLKFEDGDSSYLSRTPASAGNRKTWTWSAWVKRGNLSSNQNLFSVRQSSSQRTIIRLSSDKIDFLDDDINFRLTTNAVLRDTSSWYHIVIVADTSQSTSSDRLKIYVNGEQITSFSTSTYPSQNYEGQINNTVLHALGREGASSNDYFDGYLAEVNFIDGTALDPTSFGETKEGIWIPKDPTGLTYGTNGFRLPFTETTSANGFNTVTYTGNGATQSVGGVGFKPDLIWLKSRSQTYDHGLVDSVRGVTKFLESNTTDTEATVTNYTTSFDSDGFSLGVNNRFNQASATNVAWCWGGGTNDKTYTVTVVSDSGNKYRFDGHGTSSIALNLTEGATYTFNYPSAHPLRFSTTSNGTHGGGTEYTTGVTYVSSTQVKITVASGAPTLYYYCSIHSGMGGQINTNSTQGSSHLEGSIISTVKANQDYGFSVVSYTGTGSNATVGHGLGAAPKMIIVKNRDSAESWAVFHSDIGATKFLYLNLTNAAGTSSAPWNDTAPTNSLFSVGTANITNASADDYVAYCFADVSGYQKIGTYTGNGSATGPTVTLGFRPAFLLIKRTDSTGEWILMDNTRHPSNPNDLALFARLNYAEASSSSYEVDFNSDGFQLKNTNSSFNASSGTYIYLAIADTRDALFTSDASGNGNHWTPNALQHSDVMPDTPTDGFAVLNNVGNTTNMTFSEGNLQTTVSGTSAAKCEATFAVSSGKWYWEVYIKSFTSFSTAMVGVKDITVSGHETHNFTHPSIYAYYSNTGNKYNSGNQGSYGATFTTGDIIGVALDLDAGTLTFYKNGVSQGTAFSSLTGTYTLHLGTGLYAWVGLANFGQDSSFNATKVPQGNADGNGKGDFFYAPPSGFLALCNANLPDPAIDPNAGENPEDYFNTVLYSGNGSSQSITGVGFQPDWSWVKSRNTSGEAQKLVDSVRGAGLTVFPSGTSAEIDYSGVGLNSFDTDGFTVSHSAANNQWNVSGRTYVAWNWKAGTSFSNSSGTNGATIDSTGSVNTEAGFSIVSYTGDNTNNNGRIAHGLSSAPEMIIAKRRDSTSNWWVYHKDLNGGTDPYHYYLLLNSTAAQGDRSSATNKVWGTSNPDADTFGAGKFGPNGTGTRIAYCFHGVEGYSKFGSYVGNGSSNGPFVYTGFRPAFIICKAATGAVQHWWMFDNKREGYNVDNDPLYPNLQSAEGTADMIDICSNGFKHRNSSAAINGSGNTFIYMAFAEQPFKYSNAR